MALNTARAGWIEEQLAEGLKHMVGFRNIAVHDYQTLLLPITVKIITHHLDAFLQYSAAIFKQEAQSQLT